mmetsp:Transcript_27701/g.20805  ORF Transcript_27701/g.20805 Transcript_27701/m.20805 type:complete len:111 (-) Transcript_27701:78-410(-)|eukprot:CAMPEP_0202969156 /NCGR_PEP_ID=MMETSP1396-20130829/14791_1 /ASSEMBLY_ACC=CAM_ASM_000872 /TAXON_ID= /ORGANISM="Pseudokeronopsis sp., Strain Brazil" /LENGTH=110 /DNA_ID=CAMNT_0049696365 /DNA_START=340 /DNA_END=672 /DNA_ORIENTATION=-
MLDLKDSQKKQEKLDQDRKKISSVTYRLGNQSVLLDKELEQTKKEMTMALMIKDQAERRRMELARRLREEKELIATLRELVKKYNKEITNTNSDKDVLRGEVLKTEKLKQ